MLLIHCPFCGPRSEMEFAYRGEAHIVRPLDAAPTDTSWSDFLYMRKNRRGRHRERWQHVYGCDQYLNVVRDTVGDHVVAVYRVNEDPKETLL